MNYNEFAETVKTKYPEYKDVDNKMLAEKIVAKYPEYKDAVEFADATPEAPGMLKSAALGAMSGIPGATAAVSGIQSLSPDTTYEQAHKGLEESKDAAWNAHPVAYGGGKTAGMVGTAFAAPASIPGAIGVGALSGLDMASKPSDVPTDVVKGAVEGGVFGKAGQMVGENVIAPLANKILPGMAKRTLASMGSKTSLDDIQAYLKNPEAIRTAMTKPEIGEQVAGATNDITQASKQLSQNARGILNPNKAISAQDLKDVAMNTTQKYFVEGNPATAADDTAVKAIVEQYQKLAQIAEDNNGTVPEDVLRSMIDHMQAATKDSTFGNPEAGASQTALKEFSGKLNDLLRGQNPEYAKQMKPAAEAAGLSKDLQDQFKLENGKATDATFNKVGGVLKEGKTEGYDLLNKIKDLTGQDLVQALKDAGVKENFNAPGAGGALKTLMTGMGFGAGKMTGIPFGGIAGAATGRYMAEGMNGGHIAKNIMDAYMGGQKSWASSEIRPLVQKYGPILTNAAKVGGNQLAATHFVLATSDPEYQKLVDHAQGQNAASGGSGGYHP